VNFAKMLPDPKPFFWFDIFGVNQHDAAAVIRCPLTDSHNPMLSGRLANFGVGVKSSEGA
jgi:hypothetical protein